MTDFNILSQRLMSLRVLFHIFVPLAGPPEATLNYIEHNAPIL